MMGILLGFSLFRRSHHATSLSQDKKDGLVRLIDETRETRYRGGMDVRANEEESDFEFWPIQHPNEPLDEDRPVKCPIPDSSIINDGRMYEERFSDSLIKRAELPALGHKECFPVVAAELPVRAVRKRHHTLTRGDHTTYPNSPQNITIFDMLQHFNKFES